MPRHVTLICGPPCSGKTTLARKLAQPDELVLDFDVIAQNLGSRQRWRHTAEPAIRQEAERLMHNALCRIAQDDHIRAIVIRSLPHPDKRAKLARAIRADEVYVLHPPVPEVLARAKRDGRPKGTATTIRQWYRQYRPSEVDTPCPPGHAWTAGGSPHDAPDALTAQDGDSSTPTSGEEPQPSAATTAHGGRW